MTIDFLKLEGTIPECSDALIILVKIGAKVLLHCFTIAVGTGSRLHCLLGHPRISFWISSSFVEQSVLYTVYVLGNLCIYCRNTLSYGFQNSLYFPVENSYSRFSMTQSLK